MSNRVIEFDAVLGNALPVKMPPEWEGRLEELEAVVGGRGAAGRIGPTAP